MKESRNPGTGENELTELRQRIDRVDRAIVELLEERFDIVSGVIEYKRRKNLPVLDENREKQKLEALSSLCREDTESCIAQILQCMMDQSRSYQSEHSLQYGLLGRVLGHSHSPEIHRMLGGYRYGLFERSPEELDDFFTKEQWQGISVTIPYKRDAMEYCDVLSDTAVACCSVNTVVRVLEDGGRTTCGLNTDYDGFRYVVSRSGAVIRGKKALVLGSGGVSGTVAQVLKDLGASDVTIISRSGENNYENIERHADAQVLVNTTPVGMHPGEGETPLDIRRLPHLTVVFDLIYNPLRTRLMLDAEEAGIPAYGGLPMLVAQAERAFRLFMATKNGESSEEIIRRNGRDPEAPDPDGERPDGPDMEAICRSFRLGLEDILLIGMPGAGKTTIGQALAGRLDRPFVDMDQVIQVWQGRTPEEIIREDGVQRFRDIETEAMEKVLRKRTIPAPADADQGGPVSLSGPLVIATGGGCVERRENRRLIRENGRVIWVRRPAQDLPLDGRPVSQKDGVDAILDRRSPMYASWSDLAADACGIDETAELILDQLNGGREE